MKIALIYPVFEHPGGAEKQVLHLAIELQKLGNEVDLFTTFIDEERCYPDLINQVEIHPLFKRIDKSASNSVRRLVLNFQQHQTIFKMIHDLGKSYRDLLYMTRLGRSIRGNFDIINCHNFTSEWAAFEAKKRLKIPIVWMCNEPPYWFRKISFFGTKQSAAGIVNFPLYEMWGKYVVKNIEEIIVLDELNKKEVKTVFQRNAVLIRSGIDIERFRDAKAGELRRKYGLAEDDFVLLQVGTLVEYKRFQDSILALKTLANRRVKLMIIGKGPEKTRLERLATDLGIRENVIFTGTIDEEDLPMHYASSDVLLFPAIQTWGLTVIEAMANSKPVIVSSGAGVSEIIQNEVNGLIVPPKSPSEIASKVKMLQDNPYMRKYIGENAQKYVIKNLSWRKYAIGCLRIFQKVLRRNI
jgi:glycosyltransferase involved in cell wall biosynthesis